MANTKFVTVDSNGAQVNQELGATVPGYSANTTFPAPALILPIDAIGDASSSFVKTVPTSQGATYRIIGVQIVKAAATGGAGDAIAVLNNGNALTGSVSLNTVADKSSTWAPIDDAYQVYTAGNPIGVSTTKAANDPSCYVYLHLVKLT